MANPNTKLITLSLEPGLQTDRAREKFPLSTGKIHETLQPDKMAYC
jgi:hypothetical protein